ncbi:hypothetical protein [Bdellovibrio sp. GT3]|uniref:hypothetical protein n=1 Tax=Bdellovibrio sp. GT3 TaxID=3136282 RepID=UPI0030F493F9
MKNVWLAMLIVVGLSHAVHSISTAFDVFGVIGVMICISVSSPTNWLLVLPYSRRKIMGWFALDSLVATLSAVLFSALIAIPFNLFPVDKEWDDSWPQYFTWGSVFLFCGLARFSLPIKHQGPLNYSNILRKRLIWVSSIVGIGGVLLFYFGKQPLFWLTLSLLFVIVVPLISYQGLVPPSFSLKRFRNRTAGVFISLLIAIGCYGLWMIYISPVNKYSELVLGMMGDLRVPISEPRALELLKHPSVGESKYSLYLNESFGSGLTLVDVKAKAEKCNHADCFALATVMSRSFKEGDRLEIFAAILGRCGLKQSPSTYVYCNTKIEEKYVDELFNVLAKSSAIEAWLQSDNVNKRFAALRCLESIGASIIQMKEIDSIIEKYNDISSFEANRLISFHQPRKLIFQAKCKIDKTDLLCAEKADFWISTKDSKDHRD